MPTLAQTLTYQPQELAFGTSGLRGLVSDMTDLECYVNTVGFLRFLTQAESLPAKATVYVAGDLRYSTPRILRATCKAITDSGHKAVYCGLISTPAVTYFAMSKHSPCIMITGSHIPEDRNGMKFCKSSGEVLKEDELAIKEAVGVVRVEVYNRDARLAGFTPKGELADLPELPAISPAANIAYTKRYVDVFAGDLLAGKKVVLYQHSSVLRDVCGQLLQAMGAEVVPVGRSDTFVPIDTENVTPDDQAYFKILARDHPDAFAIVSADGDGDRPFVIDEQGVFHRGDVLGLVVAQWLKADFAAFPVSVSDVVDSELTKHKVKWQHTKIGSPYVIVSMYEALRSGSKRVMGWEVNGGFILGSDVTLNGKRLLALPTREALLPIFGALIVAAKRGQKMSELFGGLPQRFTQAGLLNNFPAEVYTAIASHFAQDLPATRTQLGGYFTAQRGFGAITHINNLDGVRIYFDNGDIAHLRQSSNAPQLRIYSVASSQQRADDIVAMAIADSDGIFRQLQRDIAQN